MLLPHCEAASLEARCVGGVEGEWIEAVVVDHQPGSGTRRRAFLPAVTPQADDPVGHHGRAEPVLAAQHNVVVASVDCPLDRRTDVVAISE
jgi:hypothetical protein